MFKLLVTLAVFLMVGLTLLGLRQHRLELTSQRARIFNQIKEREDSVRDNDVTIARETNPWAILAALKDAGIHTGDALLTRVQGPPGPSLPAVETDLVAPLLENAHNPPTTSRPH